MIFLRNMSSKIDSTTRRRIVERADNNKKREIEKIQTFLIMKPVENRTLTRTHFSSYRWFSSIIWFVIQSLIDLLFNHKVSSSLRSLFIHWSAFYSESCEWWTSELSRFFDVVENVWSLFSCPDFFYLTRESLKIIRSHCDFFVSKSTECWLKRSNEFTDVWVTRSLELIICWNIEMIERLITMNAEGFDPTIYRRSSVKSSRSRDVKPDRSCDHEHHERYPVLGLIRPWIPTTRSERRW